MGRDYSNRHIFEMSGHEQDNVLDWGKDILKDNHPKHYADIKRLLHNRDTQNIEDKIELAREDFYSAYENEMRNPESDFGIFLADYNISKYGKKKVLNWFFENIFNI